VADRGDAKADQVVGGQVGQDVAVDVVVAKRRRILVKTQFVEPIGDVFGMPPFIP
jgi:hypothetical protein